MDPTRLFVVGLLAPTPTPWGNDSEVKVSPDSWLVMSPVPSVLLFSPISTAVETIMATSVLPGFVSALEEEPGILAEGSGF